MSTKQLYAYSRTDGVVGFGFQIYPNPDAETRIHHSVAWPDKPCERYSEAMLKNQQIACKPVELGNEVKPETDASDPAVGKLIDSPDDLPTAGSSPESPPVQTAANPAVSKGEPEPVAADSTETATDPASPDSAATAPEATTPATESTPEAQPPVAESSPSGSAPAAESTAETEAADSAKSDEAVLNSPIQGEPVDASQPEPPSQPEPEPSPSPGSEAEPTASESAAQTANVNRQLEAAFTRANSSNATIERKVQFLIKSSPLAKDLDIIRFLSGKGVQVTAEFVRKQRVEFNRLVQAKSNKA